jgi:hypothetical protein
MTDDEISIQFATYAERDLDWQSRGFFKRICNAVVAIGHALLAIHVELRRLNEGRDQFHREVLEVLTQAKAPGRCTAMRGEQPHDRCVHPDGHIEAAGLGLHLDETGIVFKYPVGHAGDSEGPSGAGAAAQVAEKEGP